MARSWRRPFNLTNADRRERPASITPLIGAIQLPKQLREWTSRVIFLPEQKLIITASSDNVVRVYNLDTEDKASRPLQPRATFEHHTDWVRDVVQLGDDLVASVGMDNRLLTWRPSTGELVGEWKHTTFLYSIAKLDVSRIVVGDHGDVIVLAHDCGTSFRVQKRLPESHRDVVNEIVVNRNLIVTCSKDGNVKIWNSTKSDPPVKLKHRSEVNSAAVSEKFIVTVCADGSVCVYKNAAPYPLDFVLRCDSPGLHAVEILNETIVTVAGTKGLCFICLSSKSYHTRLPLESKLFSFVVLPDGRIAFSDKRGYCAILSPPESVRRVAENYASSLYASSSVSMTCVSEQYTPLISHQNKGPDLLETCSTFITTKNCGVIALHRSEGFINLIAVGRDKNKRDRLVVHAMAQLFMRKMDIESPNHMMRRSQHLNSISVIMNAVVGSIPALDSLGPHVFRGGAAIESLLGIGKSINSDSEYDCCVDRFSLVTDVELDLEAWSSLPVAKKKAVEIAAFNLGLSLSEFGEKLKFLAERKLNDCVTSSVDNPSEGDDVYVGDEIDGEYSQVIHSSSITPTESANLGGAVPSTPGMAVITTSNSIGEELEVWRGKGVNKDIVGRLKSEELATCIAAYIVNYEVKFGGDFVEYKAELTKRFERTNTFGEHFAEADEEDKRMLLEMAMKAVAKFKDEEAQGPAKMRVKKFLRMASS